MPASIAHMLISRQTRETLRKAGGMADFLKDVLDAYPTYMELGALGPDLPYYGNLLFGAWSTFVNRTDRPLGVDQWSYQLHSKDPNVFPLKMIEVTWKETDLHTEDWGPDDRKKFAFLCGFLTHMAADQTIHPIVNRIAGSYYKSLPARNIHRDCEIRQDLYALATQSNGVLTGRQFCSTDFRSWCVEVSDLPWSREAVWFRYFIQKAFVEAHAVTPPTALVGRWIKGTATTLHWFIHIRPFGRKYGGPYGSAYYDLFDEEGRLRIDWEPYQKYIALRDLNLGKTYDAFLDEAVKLACVYVRAAYKVYCSGELDDHLRRRFRSVVQNVDLGAPLKTDILGAATTALEKWKAGAPLTLIVEEVKDGPG